MSRTVQTVCLIFPMYKVMYNILVLFMKVTSLEPFICYHIIVFPRSVLKKA